VKDLPKVPTWQLIIIIIIIFVFHEARVGFRAARRQTEPPRPFRYIAAYFIHTEVKIIIYDTSSAALPVLLSIA